MGTDGRLRESIVNRVSRPTTLLAPPRCADVQPSSGILAQR